MSFAGVPYSYGLGHLSEYDVQALFVRLVDVLKTLPIRRRRTRSGKRYGFVRQGDGERTNNSATHLLGLRMLSTSKDRPRKASVVHGLLGSGDPANSGNSSGSEDELAQRDTIRASSSLESWHVARAQSQKMNMLDPQYKVETGLYDILWVTFSVKSKFRWQLPVLDALQVCRDNCADEVREYRFKRQSDFTQLVRRMAVKEKIMYLEGDYDFEAGHAKAGWRLLPLGVFTGVSLETMCSFTKACANIRVPAHVFLGIPRGFGKDELASMRQVYFRQLNWAAEFTKAILDDIDSFLEEVAEDMKSNASLESRMPFPPHLSNLYLRHCQGRQLQEDAHTPRPDEALGSSDDDLDESVSKLTPEEEAFQLRRRSLDGRTRKRIERNQVLRATAAKAADVRKAA